MGYFDSPYMFNIMEMVMNGVAMNADSHEPDTNIAPTPADDQIICNMHECPECGVIIPEGTDKCPSCGYEFVPKLGE